MVACVLGGAQGGNMTRSGKACGAASRAAALALTAGVVAACVPGPSAGPAPVYVRSGGSGGPYESAASEPPPGKPMGWAAARPPLHPRPRIERVTVQRGETLRGLALALHVPERTIVAANHLRPPYKLEAGMILMVPEGPRHLAAAEPMAPPPSPPAPPPSRAPSDTPAAVAPPGLATVEPSHPSPATTAPRIAAASPGPPTPASRSAATPPQTVQATPLPPPSIAVSPPLAGTAAPPQTGAPPARTEAAELHGGRFAWPVQGRIISGYGAVPGGGHNDGINIASPRGAPVQAIDSGIVAYAGNELRGYGNLVLIKQADGWISAYAHCDELLVKKGDKVRRGETIARVGMSGGVSQPQLHFELRRGNHAVDPREFLAPLPSAGNDLTLGEG